MLVLQLQDGSPYVFPPLRQMRQEIADMKANAGFAQIASLSISLTGVARINGQAEMTRLNYLKKVVTLRLKPAGYVRDANASTVSADQTKQTASQNSEASINQFLKQNSRNPQVGNVDKSAFGKQAFDTIRDKANSDTADLDRAAYAASRSRFWVAELQTALDWIGERITFMTSQLGVPNVPST